LDTIYKQVSQQAVVAAMNMVVVEQVRCTHSVSKMRKTISVAF